MRHFREQGKSDHEVMEVLNTKFGDNYKITSRKMVKIGGIFGVGRRTGVEYSGYIPEKPSSSAGSGLSRSNNTEKYKEQRKKREYLQAERDRRSRDEILARFAQNKEVQRVLQEKKLVLNSELPAVPHLQQPVPKVPPSRETEYTSVNYDLMNARAESTTVQTGNRDLYSGNPAGQPNLEPANFLSRLEDLERQIKRGGMSSEPASLGQLRKSMYHNEFPPFFVDRLVAQMRRELPLDELEKLEVLWEYVLLHIAENLRIIDILSPPRIMVLVGPTGVGKTTTIAKLAAQQCVEAMGGRKKVHLITLDNYRIGAQDQIRTYGEILGARVDCMETTEGLATCIDQDQESDVILIDTMGRSPRDYLKLAEMRRFLEYSGNCEIHLAVSATSGASALREIITQFKPFGFRSVILTKLDELGRIGGTLATFLQEDISLSYVTTGQKVPQDIRPASALVLFQQLREVQVHWESFAQKLEEHLPQAMQKPGNSGTVQWNTQ